MSTIADQSSFEPGDGPRLAALDLSSAIFHDGLRRGASRAGNRSALALESSPGTDVYHDGMEDLHRLLKPSGWVLLLVDGQPRLVHPEGKLSFTVSSGVHVGHPNMRTRKKGLATRNGLTVPDLASNLFEEQDEKVVLELARAASDAPFYLLVWERVTRGGNGLILELSQPARMTDGGSVNQWADRIPVAYLDIDGDAETFSNPDHGDDEFDVSVKPRG